MTNYCTGCRDDFYNGNNDLGVKECWLKENAKAVTRFRVHWWDPYPFRSTQKVKTYHCHNESGQYAFYKKDPRPSGTKTAQTDK